VKKSREKKGGGEEKLCASFLDLTKKGLFVSSFSKADEGGAVGIPGVERGCERKAMCPLVG